MELAEYMGKRQFQPADLLGVADRRELNSASLGDFEVGQENS